MEAPRMPTKEELAKYTTSLLDLQKKWMGDHEEELKEVSNKYAAFVDTIVKAEVMTFPLMAIFVDKVQEIAFTQFCFGYWAGRTYTEVPKAFQEPAKKKSWWRKLLRVSGN